VTETACFREVVERTLANLRLLRNLLRPLPHLEFELPLLFELRLLLAKPFDRLGLFDNRLGGGEVVRGFDVEPGFLHEVHERLLIVLGFFRCWFVVLGRLFGWRVVAGCLVCDFLSCHTTTGVFAEFVLLVQEFPEWIVEFHASAKRKGGRLSTTPLSGGAM
jgi:hypothetical protein